MERSKAIGYICPHCHKAVLEERTNFALMAGTVKVSCECGKSTFTSETDGLRFRLTVPCGICGGEHIAEVTAEGLFKGTGIALSCPATKQHCCVIGEEGRVAAAIRELEITATKFRGSEEDSEELFADTVIMYEFLSELKDIAARDGISCGCGSKNYGIEVRAGAVDLVCKDCGAKLRLPAATDEDLDRLCCHMTLTIPSKQ